MHSPNELLQLCRLCLVKDQVDIPIFDGDGDIRQIFHKISTCLPVKVSQDDNLPKKVCDDCSQKLDAFYIFWNKSSNSERQLLQWLSEASSTNGSSVPLSHSINTDEVVLKQEIVDIDDNPADGIPTDDLHVPTDSDYLQSFASEDYELHQEDSYNEEEASASSSVGPSATVTSRTKGAPQRKRKAAAMKSLPPPQTNSDEEDDVDAVGTKIAKTEKQSDDEGDNIEPSTFLGVPIDNEQPGPSGLDKAATDTPDGECSMKRCSKCLKIFTTLRGYKLHLRMHRNQCRICLKEFLHPYQLSNHMARDHIEKLHKCRFCPMSFANKSALVHHTFGHMLSHIQGTSENDQQNAKEVNNVNCEEVNIPGFQKIKLPSIKKVKLSNAKKVKRPKTEKVKLETKIPNFKKIKIPNLEDVKMSTVKFKHFCEICLKGFKFRNQLVLHQRTLCKKKIKLPKFKARTDGYRCSICSKIYRHKYFLESHERLHEKIFKCSDCEQGFHTLSSLEEHKQKFHIKTAEVVA